MRHQSQTQIFATFLRAILGRLGWTLIELEANGGPSREASGRHLRAVDDPAGDRVPKRVGRLSRVKYAEAFKCDPNVFESMWRTAETAIVTKQPKLLDKAVDGVVRKLQADKAFAQGSVSSADIVAKLGQLCGADSETRPVDSLVRSLTVSRGMEPERFELVIRELWRWWESVAAQASADAGKSSAALRLPHAAKVPLDPEATRRPGDLKDEDTGKTG